MVRIKHRYLLLNFLYPTASSSPSTPATTESQQRQSQNQHQPGQPPLALSFQAPTPDALTPALLSHLLRDTVAELFGDYGASAVASSLVVKYLSCPTSTAIVRVGRAHYRLVWAACAAITRLPSRRSGSGGGGGSYSGGGRLDRGLQQGAGVDVVIRVVRVSGTIRKVEEEVIRRGKAAILRAKRLGDGGPGAVSALGFGEASKENGVEDDFHDDDDDDDDVSMGGSDSD